MTKHSVQFLITYLWPPVCTLPVCFHTHWWSCKHTALHLTSEPSRSSFHWCHLPSLAQWSALLSSPRLCPSAWVSIKRLSESFMLRRVMEGCLCETVSDLDCDKSFRFLLRCLAAIKPWGGKKDVLPVNHGFGLASGFHWHDNILTLGYRLVTWCHLLKNVNMITYKSF